MKIYEFTQFTYLLILSHISGPLPGTQMPAALERSGPQLVVNIFLVLSCNLTNDLGLRA